MLSNPGIEAISFSVGSHLLTNDELERDHPEWDIPRLEQRTGVYSRPIATREETALDFAERACQQLAKEDKLRPDEIDAVIFCTETPDHPLPPNACLLHERLALKSSVAAFDITLACSGFTYGLMLAKSMILSGAASRVLLATADTYSRLIHEGDRSSRVLFGDGGAVTIVSAGAPRYRILDVRVGTAGTHHRRFIVQAGGMRLPRSTETGTEHVDRSGNRRTAEHIEMDGLGVLSFFSTTVPRAVRELLQRHDLSIDDIGLFVFHQASKVALDGIRRVLGVPETHFVIDIADIGNLVSASIPVALARAEKAGRIREGQYIMLCGFGVGLSWATALVRV